MYARKLPNGNLLVPMRAETNGVVGDAMVEVEPGSAEYERWKNYIHPDDEKYQDVED